MQRIATPGDLTARHNLRQGANELLGGVLVKPLFEKSLQTMLARIEDDSDFKTNLFHLWQQNMLRKPR